MSILLDGAPSVDGSSVKRWTFTLGTDERLLVFERPDKYVTEDTGRFRLTVQRYDGSHVGTSFADSKAHAIQLARYIERDVKKGTNDPAWQIITRAISERGVRQALALEALKKRGLYLSDEQKKQAGVALAA
jgi:hypothetical protein